MKPMLLLLRHGETVANSEGRVQGHTDSPLTPRGLEQARRYGHAVAGLIGDGAGWRVISSPLGRCTRTAALMCASAGLDPAALHIDPRLAEIDTGAWSGRTKAELTLAHPDLLGGSGLDHWAFRAPDGESHAALSARLSAWLDSLDPGDRVVTVTHGIAGRVLRGLYLGLDPDRAMRAESPQDALFVLSDEGIRRVSCPEA